MSSLFGAPPAAPAETCMSLQISCATGPQSQSFEEVRIADYLTSYRATGRPPPPCPPYPTEPAARTAQGLPPLFVPAPFPGTASTSPAPSIFGGGSAAASTSSSSASVITDPARLPLPQTFAAPVAVGTGSERESFASIAAQPEYGHWSHEELRYHAYLRGMRAPPPGTPMFAPTAPPVPVSAAAPAFPGAPAPVQDGGDTFMSITARPEFAGHSVEELRLSFLRTGAELTSAQIFAGATGPGPSSVAPSSLSLSQPTLAPPNPFSAPSLAPPPPQQTMFGSTPSPLGTHQPPTMFGQVQPQPQPQPLFGGGVQAQGQSIFGGARPGPQPTQGGFSFGSAPASTPAQQGGGGVFGAPAPAPAAPSSFSFGAPQPPAQQQGAFGAPAPAPASAPPFSFGGTPTTTQPPAQGGGGFSWGGAPPQPQPPAQGGGGGFSFGATPAPAAGAGGTGTGFAFGGRRF
ncbi:hypothetical protein MVEN_00614400 [Mycena venus]|uniref:Uncharacterized protein n=1 Tax=Mycena venus TaxID=2733690 RepID=A0A8H7D8D8_9AGAR|nr:hypothetical protein MVEN_00614400 [Mycena venus]